jgi:hypothetical protein
MLKIKIMAVTVLLMSLCVQAGTYIRNHEAFVHLSDHEKNELIIKTMELVVAMESQYNFEVRKYGYDSKRFKKFIQAITKVKSILFIDSAYAAQTPRKRNLGDWNSYGNAFKEMMNGNGSSNCLFAGWPSKAYVKKGLTYCAHPTKGYPDPKPDSGCGMKFPKKILCNPAIFGFKNAQNKDLFCVDSSGDAENSSFNCMKEALKENSSEDGRVDSKDTRLKALRDSLGNNESAFKAIQEFAYKSCVCDSTPRNFNRDYQTYMRKHRTCFGLMEMMSAVTCGADLPIDTSIFKSFNNFTNKEIIYNQATNNTLGTEIDDHYKNFIQKDVKVNATAEYNRLCGTSIANPNVSIVVAEKKYACKGAQCWTAAGADGAPPVVITCTYDVQTEGNKSEKADFTIDTDHKLPFVGQNSPLEIKGKIANNSVTLTCPLKIEPTEAKPAYVCSEATCKTVAAIAPSTAATFDCTFKVHEEGKSDKLAKFDSDPEEKPAPGAEPAEGLKLNVKNKIGNQDVTLSCPLTITLAPVKETPPITENEIEYVCDKATCSSGNDRAERVMAGISGEEPPPQAAAFNCDIEAHDKSKNPPIKIALKGSPSGTPTNDGISDFDVKIEGKNVELSCKVSMMTTAPITQAAEVKPPTERLIRPAPQGLHPPQMMIRQSSDVSAGGIK